MFDFNKKDINKFRVLGYVSLLLLFIILFVFGVRYYFSKSIMNDWENISQEKKKEIHVDCLNIFYNYQNNTAQFSYQILRNKKITSAFLNLNTRKAYESLYEIENIADYNVEFYNSRLELFLFSGRQINPDITELKKALNGERYSIVKEVGLYSFIVVFDPIRSEEGVPQGILVTSRLLDINYDVQSRFFTNIGIKREIFERYHIDVIFDFSKNTAAVVTNDSASSEYSQLGLKNINNEVVGKILISNLDQSSYLLGVISKFDNIIIFLVFVLNLVLIYWVVTVVRKADSIILKLLVVTAVLILSRFLWMALDFPGKMFTELGFDIFSPIHYASGIGFGMSKSIGELFISSIVFTIISVYSIINIIQFYKKETVPQAKKWIAALIGIACFLVSLAAVKVYDTIIQSLIYDSTVRFIDKTDIFSANQPELIVVRLIILCFSITLLLVLVSCGLIAMKYLNPHLTFNKFIRKNSSLFVFGAFILIVLIISAFSSTELPLAFDLRLLIYALAALFTLYIQRQLIVIRDYKFVNIVNFSLILLACIIFVPAVLLNKITAQENKYLEKAAKEVSQQSSDKISFLISSTLEDITDYEQLQNDIKDKNKFSKLAFNIWAKSKFYDEDLNSAVFVLDTAKKLISDFNINPNELVSDSVISFTLQSVKSQEKENIVVESDDEEELEEPEQNDLNTFTNTSLLLESGDVFQNKEMKFYSSIVTIEKSGLKNSRFTNVLGYVIIAAGYDAKNFLTQTNLGIFKNFTRDNILNKLTSNPVISEFSEGELVGSSSKDISKSFAKSLEAFRESVKDKVDKSTLRFDEFEGTIYKSYYVLTESKIGDPPLNAEKIYVVSVKVNDFGLSSFFFFSYLLFIVYIYIIFLIIYIIYKAVAYLADTESFIFFKFGFREKLFVSFLLASVIPIVILAIYTREFVKDKNENFYKNQLISDLRIVDQYIKNKMSAPPVKPNKNLKQDNTFVFEKMFDKGFSESDKNFNFYVKTKLAATTNEQLYKSDMLDTRISGNAFYNIALLKKDYFTENEQIGDFASFIVGYKPIYDNFNNLIGIVSTQTVFKQSEINRELTESLIYILGPYFTAVIILIFIVNFLSYRISNPILKLQKATEQLSKGNIDVQVKSNSKDEIGELVKSFNRMIKELKRSRAELKRAEREGAWRDIARQVAHEIKNPLTPMKLAMQHLHHSYMHGSKDFKSIIQTTNKLIIDQIETLNKIATEFSSFAKLPSRNYELLNINDILNDVVKLMNTNGKITLKLDRGN